MDFTPQEWRELLECMKSIHPEQPDAPASPDSLRPEVCFIYCFFFGQNELNISILFFILQGTA